MSSYDDEELTVEEEERHARRGACAALLIFPPLVCCILWVILSFTADGRVLAARGYLHLTYNGIPISNLTQGFPGIARASCALDRQTPRPQSYDQLQARYQDYYSRLVTTYRDAWRTLKDSGGDMSQYEDPVRVPPDLARGKQIYCR